MATIDETFSQAVQYHQSGEFSWAEYLYRQILDASPDHADATCLLGCICSESGRFAEAATQFRRAIELRPYQASLYNDLGVALAQLGQRDEAIYCFRQVISLDPQNSEALNNLGIALAGQGQLADAISNYRQCLVLNPGNAFAHNNLGIVLRDTGDFDGAMAHFGEALRMKPDYAEAYNNLGITYVKRGDIDSAVNLFRQSLQFKPNYPKAHNNLGNALMSRLELDEALGHLQQALALDPAYADAHMNLGMAWLLLGYLEHGWPEYEWRWHCQVSPPRPFSQPLWDGSPLASRTILLHAEQGLGDALQFVRYAPFVKEQGGTVIVESSEGLIPLLRTCPGVDRVVAKDSALPAFDTHAALLSLPGIFRTTLATIPANVPYLFADSDLVEKWKKEMETRDRGQRSEDRGQKTEDGGQNKAGSDHSPLTTLKIGIAWQGNPQHPNDRFRSVKLERFAPLAELPGVQVYSLQKGVGSEQLAEAGERWPIIDLASRCQTFADTAAALMNLDLAITVDSALAHCAGALGVPIWVVLPYSPDWRWLLDRDDSPWYPTMRLFRQAQADDWNGVFSRVVDAVKQIRTGTPSPR
jgi:Flp pilus assembly protein TadD